MNRLLIFAAALCCVAAPIHGQDAAPRSAVYEVSEVDSMPRPINVEALQAALERSYPPALLRAGRGGRVLLSFVVAADGSTAQTRVVESTDSAFDAPSLASVAVLRWTPGSLGGSPVATRVEIPIEWEAPAPASAAIPEARAGADGTYEMSSVTEGPQLENPDYLKTALRRLYPPNAMAQRVNARVDLRIRLDANGTPTDYQIVRSSDSRFNQPSIQVLTGARFRPAQIDGRSVPVWIILPLQWELEWQ